MTTPSATALSALKNVPAFRHTSLRLLADLVESGAEIGDEEHELDAALLFLHEGTAHVEMLDDPKLPGRVLAPGRAVVSGHRPLCARKVRVRPVGKRPLRGRSMTETELREAVECSPSLGRSLDPAAAAALGTPRLHLLWLTEAPGLGAPLAACAELLAAAIAAQFEGEPPYDDEVAVALVLHDPGVELLVWRRTGYVRIIRQRPTPRTRDAVVALLDEAGVVESFVNVVIVRPERPQRAPWRAGFGGVHRIVYLTRELLDRVPSTSSLDVLDPRLLRADGTPRFCSFVATVLGRPRRGGAATALETVRLADDDEGTPVEERVPTARVVRDRCRLLVDVGDLVDRRERWRAARAWTRGSFPSTILADPALGEGVRRWARAVTNRRVGLALSGGGAAMYRLVPFIKRLEDAGVPIDVVAGVSGGAMLGAYYCRYGRRGLNLFVEHALPLQFTLLPTLVDSRAVTRLIDAVADGARVEDLDRAFAPITIVLQRSKPPEVHVVTRGTLGQAVRASGAAPGLFGPDDEGERRYLDGGLGVPIPAQAVRDAGADLVIACNAIPGPDRRNPFDFVPLAERLYRRTPFGRLIDVWTGAAFAGQRVSRESAEDAHVFVEPRAWSIGLLEQFAFYRARSIVEGFQDDPHFPAFVDECVLYWEGFRKR